MTLEEEPLTATEIRHLGWKIVAELAPGGVFAAFLWGGKWAAVFVVGAYLPLFIMFWAVEWTRRVYLYRLMRRAVRKRHGGLNFP